MRLHKLRRHWPAINKEALDWIAHTDSVAASGVLVPILITAEGQIADGDWRWQAAKDWQIDKVPVTIIPEELVPVVMAETLIARKQMTRGAAVYLLLPLVKDVVHSAELRRLANIQEGRNTNEIELKPQHFSNPSNSDSVGRESIKNLCLRWGVSWDTFSKARLVHSWLNEPDFAALKRLHTDLEIEMPNAAGLRQLQEDLKLEFEHKLLIGDKNLWNLESGIKGRLTGSDGLPNKQLELFGNALDSLAVRAARFTSPNAAAPEIRKWIKVIETLNNEEEAVAKLESVAQACDVTVKTIRDHLKELKKTSTAEK